MKTKHYVKEMSKMMETPPVRLYYESKLLTKGIAKHGVKSQIKERQAPHMSSIYNIDSVLYIDRIKEGIMRYDELAQMPIIIHEIGYTLKQFTILN